ncbi:MAG: hypothetical protein IJ692_04110 [Alloprevotella sp.]|nr:hypothetical protein [Alloprevotella sp.]MBR1652556.1 hypothetical protein [Alloprevotella sp.]
MKKKFICACLSAFAVWGFGSPAALAQSQEALRAQCERLESTVDSLRRVYVADSIRLEQARSAQQGTDTRTYLQNELAELEAAKATFLQREVESRRELLERPFSLIPADSLELTRVRLEPFAAVVEVRDFLERLHDVELQKGGADEVSQILRSPYDDGRVSRGLRLIRGLGMMSQAQQQEMGTASEALKNFGGGLQAFRSIIADVDEALKVFRSNPANGQIVTMAQGLVARVMKEHAEDIERINSVPYLQERFVRYRAAMQKAPLVHLKDVEDEINKQ